MLAQPYNEEAFRYLLAVERERFDRSGRPFLLLLMAPAPQPGVGARIARPVARKLFAGLRSCLRETDFIGWYHEERVAGAVLTDLGDRTAAAVGRRVGHTLGRALREQLFLGRDARLPGSRLRARRARRSGAGRKVHP